MKIRATWPPRAALPGEMEPEIIELTKLATRARFGEFLVQQQVLDRFQLFRSLQLQDRAPGRRLGECAVALGFAPRAAIEQLHLWYARQHAGPAGRLTA